MGPFILSYLEFSGKKEAVSMTLNSIPERGRSLMGTVCKLMKDPRRRRTVVSKSPGQSCYPGTT